MANGGFEDEGAGLPPAPDSLQQARREAAADRKRLEEIQALTKVGSWEWELSSERASWSDELRRIAGLEPDEPVPTFPEFLEYVHPDDRDGFLAAMQRSFEGGGDGEGSVRHYTYRAMMRDGTEKVIESHSRVETDASGKPVRIFGAAQDVTERHRTEASMRMQGGLLDQVGVAVMASDVSRRLTHWNRAAEEMLGVPRSEAVGATIDEVMRIPPESTDQRAAMVREIAQGRTWEGELSVHGPGDSKFPAYATNGPVRNSEGKIVGYSGVLMDLSEMKSARAALQRRAEEQAALATLSRTAMSSEGVDALLVQAMGLVRDLLDVEFADVHELKSDGQTLRLRASLGRGEGSVGEETTLDEDSQAAHTLAERQPTIVEDYASEARFQVPDWAPGETAASGASVVIEGGETSYGVLGAHSAEPRSFSMEDVQMLQSVANVLAAALARQRAQRLESQLHQNQRLEAVGQLAGGVAHDFNNLLVVILNYAEFLLEGAADERTREDVGEIKTAAERAARLTHQLLVFSRREVVVTEAVDLGRVIGETEGLLRRTLREHIRLTHSCADGLWKVRLGSGQAEQILVNLLVNAGDAMPDGGSVDIAAENLELVDGQGRKAALPAGRYMRLTVADSGTGMSEEIAAQAFDPFFTTKKDNGGTGLGLATVYGIVKEADGHVEIYTEPGQGTAFKIYLPAIFDEAAAATPDTRTPVPAAGETILLVEDEENVSRLAERILSEHGYRVLSAADGRSAVELATGHEGEIALLLTDVVMPNLSGPQLARELRELRPELKTLFMSGYTGEVISRHGVVEEGVALVEKPFDSKGLLFAVSNALHGLLGEAAGR